MRFQARNELKVGKEDGEVWDLHGDARQEAQAPWEEVWDQSVLEGSKMLFMKTMDLDLDVAKIVQVYRACILKRFVEKEEAGPSQEWGLCLGQPDWESTKEVFGTDNRTNISWDGLDVKVY